MQDNKIEPTLTASFSYKVGVALKELSKRLQEECGQTYYLITDGENGDYAWSMTSDKYVLQIDKSKYYPTSMETENQTKPKYDIQALKRRIKHSKNPMEKKSFEKQLNLAYKERKRNDRSGKGV